MRLLASGRRKGLRAILSGTAERGYEQDLRLRSRASVVILLLCYYFLCPLQALPEGRAEEPVFLKRMEPVVRKSATRPAAHVSGRWRAASAPRCSLEEDWYRSKRFFPSALWASCTGMGRGALRTGRHHSREARTELKRASLERSLGIKHWDKRRLGSY